MSTDAKRSVAAWLEVRGLSLRELVNAARLEQRVVEAIVASRWTPSPAQRRRIAEALGVAVEQIDWEHSTPVDHIHGHGPQFGRSP